MLHLYQKNFPNLVRFKSIIIISEKLKTKQKKLPTKPRVTHLKKIKIIQAGTSQVHYYLHIICIDLHVNNSEHHVATGKFILPCLLVTELK